MIVLAEKELRFTARGPLAVPAYLSARDEVWIRELVGELGPLAGAPADDVEARLAGRASEIARSHGVPSRALAGVRRVLGRWWKTQVVSTLPPPRVRSVLFELAAAGARLDRDDALDRAAAALGVDRAAVLASLFADRPGARHLVGPDAPPAPSEVVLAYNLALLQGLLVRSSEARVRVRSHVRSVVRFAKLARLICTYVLGDDGTTIALSGPLSLFRQTTKYGHALAAFVPAVLSTPGWSLRATCLLGEQRLVVAADAADPLARPHALPRDSDSALERRLVRDVRRLGRGFTIERETAAIPVGDGVCFPDFTLCKGGARVLVEIVGFYTPEYLASKLRALRAIRERHPILVLVDESLACADAELAGASALRYRGKVDAAALLDAADALIAARRRAGGEASGLPVG
jgi:hypothetical protein